LNRPPNITDLLACEQAACIDPNRCQLYEKEDGSYLVAYDAPDGVTYVDPLRLHDDEDWLFAKGTLIAVSIPTPSTYHPPRDFRKALSSPGFTVEMFSALTSDPNIRAIAELSNLRMIAIAEADSLVDGLGQARGMLSENDFESLDELLAMLVENARAQYAALRNPPALP
jgi:hypothetical protein